MDKPRESIISFRAAFALFAATLTVAVAGWFMMGSSHVAAQENANATGNKVERGLTLNEWLMIAK